MAFLLAQCSGMTLVERWRDNPPADYRAIIDDRWQSFIAFWLVAGLALLGLGIAVFVAVHNGHRVGGALVLVGIVCLVVGLGVRSAARRAD